MEHRWKWFGWFIQEKLDSPSPGFKSIQLPEMKQASEVTGAERDVSGRKSNASNSG